MKFVFDKRVVSVLISLVMMLSLVSCDVPEGIGSEESASLGEESLGTSESMSDTSETEDLSTQDTQISDGTGSDVSEHENDTTVKDEDSTTDETDPLEETTEEKIVLDEEMVLTYENLHELSSGKNIVIFLVDRFDAKYYRKMEKKHPDFFEGLDGFTYYNDYTSLHCRTYPGVASILTNLEHDYTSKKANAFDYFYSNGGTMRTLHDHGYTLNVYTETSYVYNDATLMSEYVSNTGYVSLSEEFLVGADATVDLLERIKSRDFYTVDSKGQFTFIHLYGCHNTDKNSYENIEDTFEIIYYYIEQMKTLGVYDDATIVITGDHAAALSDSKYIGKANGSDDGTRVTAMLFKRSGDSGSSLRRSEAQVSQDELWATIFESEGMLSEKKGDSFFDIPEGEDRERRYLFYMYKNAKNNNLKYSQVIEYKITGTANDPANWQMITTPVTTE